MNRYLIFLVLLTLGQSAVGQRLAGTYKYYYPEDWISVALTLSLDSTFLWRSCNGYGDVIATGEYSADAKTLTLRAHKAYRFYEDSYRELIAKSILDSCCNVEISKGGKRITEYNQTFYNLQSKADSCILNNMHCILTSNKLDQPSKRRAFRETFLFTTFAIVNEDTIAFQGNDTHWILKRQYKN